MTSAFLSYLRKSIILRKSPIVYQAFRQNMSTGRLSGKVAVITGSTQGIGLAIAEKFLKEGAKVVVSSRKQGNVDNAVNTLSKTSDAVVGVPCHVGKTEDREALIQKAITEFGGLDILVTNAATNPVVGGVLDCPPEAWDKIFEINVKNSLQLAQLAVPCMKKREGGAIVFISSIAGLQPFQLLGAYSVSKTALLGLTKVLAGEVGKDNIRVNCVAPGIVKTNFSAALFMNKEYMDEFLKQIPLGRAGKTEEIAGVVSFLCSDEASYITGETYVAAGGQPSRL